MKEKIVNCPTVQFHTMLICFEEGEEKELPERAKQVSLLPPTDENKS